jgi:phi13 family phage major tail protein
MANKIQVGLKNVHYAVATEDENGALTYGTPKRILGAVEITLEPRGDQSEFFADDVLFWTAGNNQGYNGTLNIATIPESFAQECLGEVKDPASGVLIESAANNGSMFALMFEFDGDERATRHVMYRCVASRPTVAGATKTDTVEPNTSELTFIASARLSDSLVKARTTTDTLAAIYNNWFTAVFEPTTVAVTSVTLLPETVNLAVGAIQQLAATVLPANATNRNVQYTSSDPDVATVDANGLITAVGVGTATITVTTVNGSFTDTCAVTVA